MNRLKVLLVIFLVEKLIKLKKVHLLLNFIGSTNFFRKNKGIERRKIERYFYVIDNHLRSIKVRDYCLVRSITAFTLLNRFRNIQLILGVQVNPFQAHAWIESDGSPVCEDLIYCCGFERIMVVS